MRISVPLFALNIFQLFECKHKSRNIYGKPMHLKYISDIFESQQEFRTKFRIIEERTIELKLETLQIDTRII